MRSLEARLSSTRYERLRITHSQGVVYPSPQETILEECMLTLREKNESFHELLGKAESLIKAVR
jgi:hypothetical protein